MRRIIYIIIFFIPIYLNAKEIRILDSISLKNYIFIEKTYSFEFDQDNNILSETLYLYDTHKKNVKDSIRTKYYFTNWDSKSIIREESIDGKWVNKTKEIWELQEKKNSRIESTSYYEFENEKWIADKRIHYIDSIDGNHNFCIQQFDKFDTIINTFRPWARYVKINNERNVLIHDSFDYFQDSIWVENNFKKYTYVYDENDSLEFYQRSVKKGTGEYLEWSTYYKYAKDYSSDTISTMFLRNIDNYDSSFSIRNYTNNLLDSSTRFSIKDGDTNAYLKQYYKYEDKKRTEELESRFYEGAFRKYTRTIWDYYDNGLLKSVEAQSNIDSLYNPVYKTYYQYNKKNLLSFKKDTFYRRQVASEKAVWEYYFYDQNDSLNFYQRFNTITGIDSVLIYQELKEYNHLGLLKREEKKNQSSHLGVEWIYNLSELQQINSYEYIDGEKHPCNTDNYFEVQHPFQNFTYNRFSELQLFWKSTVGIEKLSNNKNITYPNPANELINLTLNISTPGIAYIIIYNETGNDILKLETKYLNSGELEYQIDTSHLQNGRYYYLINFKEETLRGSFVISK